MSTAAAAIGHLAKDGLYYETYEEMRKANIRRIDQVLVEKGLANKPLLQSMECGDRIRAPTTSLQHRRLPAVVSPSSKAPQPRRSSTRLRNSKPSSVAAATATTAVLVSAAEVPSGGTNNNKRSVGLIASNDEVYGSNEEEINPNGGGDEEPPAAAPPRRIRRMMTSTMSLSNEERHELSKFRSLNDWCPDRNEPMWVSEMQDYLIHKEELTTQNYRSVMRQVRKLVSSTDGIEYTHWGDGVVFGAHVVSLADDFNAMYEQGLEFEAEHGWDKGNGWLLRHPIKKLTNFQRYYYLTHKGHAANAEALEPAAVAPARDVIPVNPRASSSTAAAVRARPVLAAPRARATAAAVSPTAPAAATSSPLLTIEDLPRATMRRVPGKRKAQKIAI